MNNSRGSFGEEAKNQSHRASKAESRNNREADRKLGTGSVGACFDG